MRYLTRLFHKKGFTLTELIIVMAIISVMMLSVVLFSGPVRLMVKSTDAKAETLTISNTIGDYLEHTLAYADDIRIYAGVDLKDTDGALQAINTDYGKMIASDGKHATANDRSGMIVFSFEEKDDPLYSGHRIYELLAKDTDGKKLELINTEDPDSGLTVNKVSNAKQLFLSDFYGRYSFFLEADEGAHMNSVKGKQYLGFTVRSYYFDGSISGTDDKPVHFKKDTAKAYYQNTDPTVNTLTDYDYFYTGEEQIFFCLENSSTSGANYEYHRGYTKDESTPTVYGSDVVILYNVRTYSYS